MNNIKPKLGFFDMTMIVVSLVIGIGIFRTPAIVAEKAGSPTVFFTAWILGGIISIFGALTFAEIGSRLPVAGGFYKVFSHCYHPAFAFMLNWSVVITNAASAVGVAIVGAEYLNPIILPASMQGDTSVKATAFVVTIVLFLLNFLGIKTGARTQNLLSLVKIVLIVVFSLAVFGHHSSAPTSTTTTHLISSPFTAIQMLGVSLISIFFTYGGYQNTINFGADVKDPERNIPRSIFAGIGIVIVLYLMINLAYYSVLGFEGMQHSKLLAAELAKSFLGEKGFAITSIAIFISTLGYINTSMMGNPRVYYAMAEDKVLPRIFQQFNERTMAQEFALSFFVALMIIFMFLLGTFGKIINFVMFIDSLSLAAAAGTIFVFRQKEKAAMTEKGVDPNIYRLKFFPLIPLIFMFVLLMVTLNVVLSDTNSAMYGFIIFLAGFPLYKLMRRLIVQDN